MIASSVCATPSARPTVLIVDDVPANIHILYQMLKDDYEVLMTTDSGDVVSLCEQGAPDIVLLDVIMPGASGFDICRRMKKSPDLQHIPVIFITSCNAPDEEAQGLLCGAADFISKPINPTVARARIDTQLNLKLLTDRLRHQVGIDELTGLANRRRFDEQIEFEWRACQRSRSPIGLVLLDVDRFKAYNDHYGHPAGDDALRTVARRLGEALRRPRDFVARYGGEEFACIIPDSGAAETLRTAGYLCAAVEAAGLVHAGTDGGIVTISAGAAALVPQVGTSYADLTRRADTFLYAAKRAGRNRAHGQGPRLAREAVSTA